DSGKPGVKITEACEAFMSDCRRRNLKRSTIRSYEKALEYLERFCNAKGLELISEVEPSILLAFQNSREALPHQEGDKATALEASTARKELQILRAFFGFLLDHEHVEANYAKKLKPPREHRRPTMPFEQSEIDAMLTAAGTLDDDNPTARDRTRAHARAAVL